MFHVGLRCANPTYGVTQSRRSDWPKASSDIGLNIARLNIARLNIGAGRFIMADLPFPADVAP